MADGWGLGRRWDLRSGTGQAAAHSKAILRCLCRLSNDVVARLRALCAAPGEGGRRVARQRWLGWREE